MPAIQPARLKKQTSDLAAKFSEPAQFVRQLHALLDMYTDHTHRKGQAGEPSPLVNSYNAAPPVMRQVWHELVPLLKQRPADVLPLCDALWAEPNYDLRLLAARLLGKLPVDPPDQIIDRLECWVSQGLEKRILDGLFKVGLDTLQRENPDRLVDLVSSWLDSTDLTRKQAGLRALQAMVGQSGTEKLPTLFRLLTPFLRIAPARLRPDILAVLSALARFSPSETAYLLRQNLSAPDNPDTSWVIRQVLDEFPADSRVSLRQALKSKV